MSLWLVLIYTYLKGLSRSHVTLDFDHIRPCLHLRVLAGWKEQNVGPFLGWAVLASCGAVTPCWAYIIEMYPPTVLEAGNLVSRCAGPRLLWCPREGPCLAPSGLRGPRAPGLLQHAGLCLCRHMASPRVCLLRTLLVAARAHLDLG